MNITEPYCGSSWSTFQHYFKENIFGYVRISLDVIGVIFNAFNIAIFSKKNTFSSSNVLFTSLAVSDLGVSLSGIPYTWHRHLRLKTDSVLDRNTYAWSVIDYYSGFIEAVVYEVSIWHTVVLAIWRYIAVSHPFKEKKWCSLKITFVAIVGIYLLSFLYFIKFIFRFKIVPSVVLLDVHGFATKNHTIGFYKTIYEIKNINELDHPSEMREAKSSTIFERLVYILCLRLTPSVIVCICSLKLAYALCDSRKRRQSMISNTSVQYSENTEKENRINRTIRMLLGLAIFFILSHTLSVISATLALILGEKFSNDCHPAILDIQDLLALIYTTIPFIVYCVTSEPFRNDFKSLVCFGNGDSSREISENVNTESTRF